MKLIICNLWCFLMFFCAFAQKDTSYNNKEIPLTKVLKRIEKQYKIKFSYNTTSIAKERLNIKESGSLEEVLQKIQKKTALVFEKISERYYILKNIKEPNKIDICGYLVDEFTAKPIVQATVINRSTGFKVDVDANGFYELKNVHSLDPIEIQSLGYVTSLVKAEDLKRNKCKKIWVTPLNEDLDEVLITEYLTTGVTREEGGGIKIVPNKLGILPRLVEPDPLQTIQFLPGIQSPTETASGLYIRSGTPDQNLILWDGIKMYHTGHFFGLLSAFNPYIIEDVKVSRSGTEAKYGGRVSGVIDITSANEIPQRFSGGAGVNMTHVDAHAKIPVTEKFGLIFSARRAFTDIFETFTYNQYSRRVFQNTRVILNNEVVDENASQTKNLFYFSDATVKGIYEPNEKTKWEFSSLNTQNHLNFIEQVGDIVDGVQDVLDIENQGISLSRTQTLNDVFQYDIKGYFSNYSLSYRGISRFSETQQNTTYKDNELLDVGIGINGNWKITDHNKILMGYEFSSNDVSFLLGRSTDGTTTQGVIEDRAIQNLTHALYGEYRYNEKEAVKLSFGVRGNYFSELNRISIEPRLKIEFDVAPKTTARFSGERKEQVISQVLEFETRDFGLENQLWVLSGEELIPVQKGHQFAGGILYSDHGWDIDIESYYKNTKGLTSFTRGFNITEDQDVFVGKSEAVGIDFLVKKRIEDYRSWISYSYAQNRFTFNELNEGNSFPGNFDVRHSFSWSHSYVLNNFEVSLGWNFRTGIPYTPALGVEEDNGESIIRYGDINSARLATYHRLDFSSSYKFDFKKNSNWKGKIGISVLNIYNRKNELSRTYEVNEIIEGRTTQQELQVREVNMNSLGITPNLVLRIEF